MPQILTEDRFRTAHYIVSEASGYRSREQVVIASGAGILKPGAVLGRLVRGTTAATAFAGTGTGTITMDATTPVLPGAKVGAYTATAIAAAVNGGTFRVEDPDGNVIGDIAVGANFADDIQFVINDGATDFVVGDAFTITVAAGSGKYTPFNPAAADGSETAAAILYEGCDATAADVRRTATVRDSEVHADVLVWATGVTDNQKTAALASLAASGIVGR